MSLMFLEVCSFFSLIFLFILLCMAGGILGRLGKIRDYLKIISEGNGTHQPTEGNLDVSGVSINPPGGQNQ